MYVLLHEYSNADISCFDGKSNSPSIGRPLQKVLHCVHKQLLAFNLYSKIVCVFNLLVQI